MEQKRRSAVYRPQRRYARPSSEELLQKRRERLFTQALLAAVLLAGAFILAKLPGERARLWREKAAQTLAGDESGRAMQVFESLSERWTEPKPPEEVEVAPLSGGAGTESLTSESAGAEDSEKNGVAPEKP